MIALLRPRSRRRLRWLALLSLRVVRRHYLTLVSALVLVAAGVVALTDAGLAVDGGVAARTDTEVASAPETPAPAATVAPPDRSGGPHTVVYYMLKSELQRSEFEMAIQADMRDWYRRGLPVDGPVERYFLVVTTPEEEAAAFQYLNDLFKLSQTEGFGFYFFDLR